MKMRSLELGIVGGEGTDKKKAGRDKKRKNPTGLWDNNVGIHYYKVPSNATDISSERQYGF
jgi:hypothetical protein